MTIPAIHILHGGISAIRRSLYLLILLSFSLYAHAQFAPVVGFAGTTAIPGDSSAIVEWATGCTVYRGYRDIAVPDSGYASDGDSSSAIGPAGQNGTVSLGDSGIAILTFATPIADGPGFDFAVFENGFDVGPPAQGLAFLELAFIEVSSDGVRYVRFPCMDNVQDTGQISNADGMDGSKLNNLAGKYIYDYGTPFDLDELVDSPGLDVNNILYVKVIDVIGSIDPVFGTRDSRDYIVNDPYPTNFASSGFDLDAVGVINQKGGTNGIEQAADNIQVYIYPNPASDIVQVQTAAPGTSTVEIIDISARNILTASFQHHTQLHLNTLPPGAYTIRVINEQSVFSKLIVKE
jgi:hypothetical protein